MPFSQWNANKIGLAESLATALRRAGLLRSNVKASRKVARVPSLAPWALPLILAIAGLFAFTIDCQLSRLCVLAKCPGEIRRLLDMGESCFHGLGIVVIAISMHQLDPAKRRYLPRVLLCSLGAGLMADVIKLSIARIRPHSFSFESDVWSTFAGAFPLFGTGSAQQSFPSAHMAVAAGFSVVMGRIYPRARWLFATMAVLAACQRIQVGAHYLSDVLLGAALGILFARGLLSSRRFSLPASDTGTNVVPTVRLPREDSLEGAVGSSVMAAS